ncbi:MAG: hypothetical protein ACYTDY_06655, partial [Planctomycetota bacterium]
MNRSVLLAFALAALLPLLLSAGTITAQSRGKEIPFPVNKTQILRREKVVYVVTGRMKIPKGVEITCLRDVYVVGKGEGAVIEVEGRLKVHGVQDREVIFENVVVELAPEYQHVHMDMAIFRKGAALKTPARKAVQGKLFLELVDFREDAQLALTFSSGSIDVRSTCSATPTIIKAVTGKKAEENKVRLFVFGCAESHMDPVRHPGLIGGLIVEGVHDATVRINRMAGPLSAFRNCKTLLFDGNKVNSTKLEFMQYEAGGFQKTKIIKCDIYSEKVTFYSGKVDEKTVDKIKMD